MARPYRNKLRFDEESVNNLLQEIYNEAFNQRAKIARLFVKWEKFAKEGGEIQMIGDQIVKLIAAEAKNQDQKIMLLKYLKEVVYENKTRLRDKEIDLEENEEKKNISADRRNELLSFVQREMDKREKPKENK
jgi:hypothetical protein